MIPIAVAIPALAALLAGAALLQWQGAEWMFVVGTALAAGAPMLYLLARLRAPRRIDAHPLSVSTLSGLGCVMVMIAVQRFGPEHDWALYVAAAGLGIWMLWQRADRRRPPKD